MDDKNKQYNFVSKESKDLCVKCCSLSLKDWQRDLLNIKLLIEVDKVINDQVARKRARRTAEHLLKKIPIAFQEVRTEALIAIRENLK